MKNTILALTALILTSTVALAGTKTVHFKPSVKVYKPAVSVHKPSVVVHPQINTAKNYHLNYGVKFSSGHYYKGFNHSHWTNVHFHSTYGCKVYYCPYTLVNYYWCAWDKCFYPVTYCPYGRYVF